MFPLDHPAPIPLVQQLKSTFDPVPLFGKAFHAFGRDFPAVPEIRAAFVEWLRAFPDLIAAGYKSNPVWKQEGGLEKVNDGLDVLKSGKVRTVPSNSSLSAEGGFACGRSLDRRSCSPFN